MNSMNLLIWMNAWDQYHKKNFGAARRALELIKTDSEDEEFTDNLEQAKQLFDEEIEKR